MKNKNLQAKIASLKTYLDDCRAGIWSVKAWNDHTQTSYEVKVDQTGQSEAFQDADSATHWIDHTKRILSIWGGEPTFTCTKVIREKVDL